jgi:NaMN:DMB phosphoribosyltransferase
MLEVMGDNKAAVSVLADVADVYCQYINVGAVSDSKSRAVRNERVKSGTQDIRNDHAMTREEVIAAMNVGAQTAERLIAGGSSVTLHRRSWYWQHNSVSCADCTLCKSQCARSYGPWFRN